MDKKLQRKASTLIRAATSKKFLKSKRGAKRDKLDALAKQKLGGFKTALQSRAEKYDYQAMAKSEEIVGRLETTPISDWTPIIQELAAVCKIEVVLPEITKKEKPEKSSEGAEPAAE